MPPVLRQILNTMAEDSWNVEDSMDVVPLSSPGLQNLPCDKGSDKDTPVAGMDAVKAEGEDDIAQEHEAAEDAFHLAQSVWHHVEALNDHADAEIKVKKVRMGGIRVALIDSEGQAKKVPRKKRASTPDDASCADGVSHPHQEDENNSMIMYLAATIVNLAERINLLEAKCKEGTTASSASSGSGKFREGPIASSSSSGSWCSKKRQSEEKYKVPTWDPWPLDSGWCNHCEHYWASEDSEENFMVCPSVWETVMHKIFADWHKDADSCHMLESYAYTDTHVTQSLVSVKAIDVEEEDHVASRFRRRIWKPDIAGDARPLFLYHGGKGSSKYITFGCFHCQRATSLRPGHTFSSNLKRYFP